MQNVPSYHLLYVVVKLWNIDEYCKENQCSTFPFLTVSRYFIHETTIRENNNVLKKYWCIL